MKQVLGMATAQSRGLVNLLKRGWHEVPDVVGSGALALVASVVGVGTVYYYYAKDGDNRRYRDEYTVIRHDDPRADKVRKD